MSDLATDLRDAASSDLIADLGKRLRAHADRIESEPDWRAVCRALLVKYGGRSGQALIGGGTLAWARDRVDLRVDPDGDAIVIHWQAPPLKPEGV